MNEDLERSFPGVDWDFSQIIRDNVMEALSGVKGENSIKVFGPDLDRLEALATQIRDTIARVPGVDNPGVFRVQGQSNLEIPVDRQKCARWNVSAADVQNVIQTAVGGKAVSQMTEGGKTFDITLRFPLRLRQDEQSILNIPVDVMGNQVSPTAAGGPSPTGTTVAPPALTGTAVDGTAVAAVVPRRRLADMVTPLNAKG